jgi:hypothetical protein
VRAEHVPKLFAPPTPIISVAAAFYSAHALTLCLMSFPFVRAAGGCYPSLPKVSTHEKSSILLWSIEKNVDTKMYFHCCDERIQIAKNYGQTK